MPATRFTFGAGNARALARAPLYLLGAIAALVIRRTPLLWVIGSGIGLGEGALPFARLARVHAPPGTRIVWLASSDAELTAARAMGLDAELKRGGRGFRLTLRSGVIVVTHGLGDVNRWGVSRAFVVQLWHGIPLKRLHLDTGAALRVSGLPDHALVRGLMARVYQTAGRRLSLFPVASALVADRISSAFGIPLDRIAVTGDPRDDTLLAGDPPRRRAAARAELERLNADQLPGLAGLTELPDGPVVLYAPTWRDGAADPGVPSAHDWREIGEWLADHDGVLFVRAHPLGVGDYAEGPATSERIRMLGSDVVTDVTSLLPAVDALVTDYSSIAYDAALAGARTVFLAPDLEQYAKVRGLYESYREFSGGRHVTDWSGVLEWLSSDPAADAPHTAWLAGEHIDRTDGRATERVLALVLRRLGHPLPVALAEAERAPAVVRPRVSQIAWGTAGSALELVIDGMPVGARVLLDGARAQVEGEVVESEYEPGQVIVRLPLLGVRWGTPGLALPSARYRVMVVAPGAQASARLTVDALVPVAADHPLFRGEVEPAAGGLSVRISPPLLADERGAASQKALENDYFSAILPVENAVFFESFYGRSVSCNPLGIDRALARIRPDVVRYWSVQDASFAVPEGAVRVVEGSREWWRARGQSRVLVVNDWLRKRWKPRPSQSVLQTWHGTMLKRLALDRDGISLRTRLAIRRESGRWDRMLTQNSYSAGIFQSAYAFRGPIWQEGYPRNDVLVEGDAAAVRERLAIPPDARVVLYAPTWRDDRTEMVDYLDLERFAGELDEGTVLVVRGHARTLPYGRNLTAPRLVDATSYPNVADLLLIADVLVTDYSSVMFDFAGTGRPTVFFAPDLSHYSRDLRGFYFDLLADAPGPVVETRDALLDVLRDVEQRTAVFEGRRADWRDRFAPHDDGMAGERIVRRLLDEGLLD